MCRIRIFQKAVFEKNRHYARRLSQTKKNDCCTNDAYGRSISKSCVSSPGLQRPILFFKAIQTMLRNFPNGLCQRSSKHFFTFGISIRQEAKTSCLMLLYSVLSAVFLFAVSYGSCLLYGCFSTAGNPAFFRHLRSHPPCK